MKKRQKYLQTRPPALKNNCSGCFHGSEPNTTVWATRGAQHAAANQVEREVNNHNSYMEI